MDTSSSNPESRALTADVAFALESLVRVVERQSGEFMASILLLSDDGTRVLDAAGPSLPDEFRRSINGQLIGPFAGSCGTAAYRNELVIVSDIEHDPLWEVYRELARPFGLAACWSHPIRSSMGTVLGTFAMYYLEPRRPTEREIEVIASAARLAGALLERARHGASRDQLLAQLQ